MYVGYYDIFGNNKKFVLGRALITNIIFYNFSGYFKNKLDEKVIYELHINTSIRDNITT